MLKDSHGRKINYLRLAVTDRCNLRCTYCMPADGLAWLPRQELLSFDEMLRLCSLLVKMGVEKIRITGGEPFLQKDLILFLSDLSKLSGLQQISITTNGILTAPFIPQLKKLGIESINLSMDTLNPERFFTISRRDEFGAVWNTLQQLLQHKMEVKINAVVMDGLNTEDIIPLVQLTKEQAVSVRFIEEMTFNGKAQQATTPAWNFIRIIDHIKNHYPLLQKIKDPPSSTAYNYIIPGHQGTVGVIAAYSRSFCGTCNRIRITPQGMLKTCLYDSGALDIKEQIRKGVTDTTLALLIKEAIGLKAKDGWSAEKEIRHDSMATIGG